jgi:SPP1 gp7 family putative phage head morphogenesis protein
VSKPTEKAPCTMCGTHTHGRKPGKEGEPHRPRCGSCWDKHEVKVKVKSRFAASLEAALAFRTDDRLEAALASELASAMADEDVTGRLDQAELVCFAAEPSKWLKEAASVYTASACEALSRRMTKALAAEVEVLLREAAARGQRAATVRAKVLRALGSDEPDEIVSKVLAKADTLWNTALGHARAAGAMRVGKLAGKRGPAALRFHACDDDRVRPNHAAADGFLARVDDPVWEKLAPPLGYQCRCRVKVELTSVGRFKAAPAGAFSDPDFPRLGRPDEWFYGA